MTRQEAYEVASVLRSQAVVARDTASEMLSAGATASFHYYDGQREALERAAEAFESAARETPRNRKRGA